MSDRPDLAELEQRLSEERDELSYAVEDLTDQVETLREALSGCIPWVATSGRGAAQEALAIACDLVGCDPFDWTSHPDVLAARMKLLGMPDRRKEGARDA